MEGFDYEITFALRVQQLIILWEQKENCNGIRIEWRTFFLLYSHKFSIFFIWYHSWNVHSNYSALAWLRLFLIFYPLNSAWIALISIWTDYPQELKLVQGEFDLLVSCMLLNITAIVATWLSCLSRQEDPKRYHIDSPAIDKAAVGLKKKEKPQASRGRTIIPAGGKDE